MYAVVNHLLLRKPIYAELAAKVEQQLGPIARKHPAFVGLHVVEVSEQAAIVLVLFDSKDGLEQVSGKIAALWFAENVRPYLSGPVSRSVGRVVASVIRT